MWNIRMRASKAIGNQQSAISDKKITHISGAEGIFEEADIQKVCGEYIKRALNHPRGEPDEIVITIEKVKQKIKTIPLLFVKALKCKSPEEAKKIIVQKLTDFCVSKKAIINGLKILNSEKTMRGAALIRIGTGRRMEPDKERGIRVSRIGIDRAAEIKLSKLLCKAVIPAKAGIQTEENGFRVKPGMTNTHSTRIKDGITTVKEALILASKVASCPDIVAEVCISDDPDYTTGYIASKKTGYLRLANVKKAGEMHGGRVFLIKENSDINRVIQYLEKIPVIISRV